MAVSSPPLSERYRALLDVSGAIALHQDLDTLLHDLAVRLQSIIKSDFVNFVLYDAETHTMRLNVMQGSGLRRLNVPGDLQIGESLAGWVWEHQEPLFYDDIIVETRFPRVTSAMRAAGVKSVCMLPMTTADQRIGALAFCTQEPGAYDKADVNFLQCVASQVAIALENVSNRQRAITY